MSLTTLSAAAPVPTPFVAPTASAIPAIREPAGAPEAPDPDRAASVAPAGARRAAIGPRPAHDGPERPDAPSVRRVALRPRVPRPESARPLASLVPTPAAVSEPPPIAPEAPHALGEVLPAFPDAATLAAAPRQLGRPEPTRAATLAAYFNALPAPAPTAPAIAPVLAVARWPTPPPMTRPTLARVESAPPAPVQNGNGSQAASKPEAPDLDALADHVLERLRHELRDGRERLGYLLDDLR